MDEPDTARIIEAFSGLPRLDNGAIDYRTSARAPVLLCFLVLDGRLLILKRSDKVGYYRGLWSVVAGFIDCDEPMSALLETEIEEELGIEMKDIKSVRWFKPMEIRDGNIGKTIIRYPVIAELRRKPKIRLDWESDEHCWVALDEISAYEMPPGTKELIARIFDI